MGRLRPAIVTLLFLLGAVSLAACASGGSTGAAGPGAATAAHQDQGPSGDIPDSATYLVFHGTRYSLEYVEGWVQQVQPGDGVRFSDKDSFISVSLQAMPQISLDTYAHGPGMTASAAEFQQFSGPSVQSVTLPAGAAALLTFQGLSAPDPVTGKTVTLAINRYYIPGPNALAVLTEASPVGVDNVDGFRRIAQRYTWSGQ